MNWVDLNFVKIVENCLIFRVDVPVVAQCAEEAVLAVVGPCHNALWQIHHPFLQEVIRGVQRTHKLWGEEGWWLARQHHATNQLGAAGKHQSHC